MTTIWITASSWCSSSSAASVWRPVRLELSRELDGIIIDTLCRYMDVPREYVFQSATPLDLSFLFGIQDFLRQRSELFYQKRIPQKSPSFVSGRPILAQIREKDKLLSYSI